MYKIREVDADDDEIAQTLANLHHLTFFHGAAVPEFGCGMWWLACHRDEAVAFAGVVHSTHTRNSGYLCRVGVLEKHWGHSLRLRLMRAVEARGRRSG